LSPPPTGRRRLTSWYVLAPDESKVRRVLAPARVYVCLYAEAVSHVHFHLIPRYHETAEEHRGPGVFELLSAASNQGRSLVDVEAAAWAAPAIRERLEARP
jgi:diadenosine tetraphosphate (Ap4A) HIT family hydrolase